MRRETFAVAVDRAVGRDRHEGAAVTLDELGVMLDAVAE
jgi:hypothetical protein